MKFWLYCASTIVSPSHAMTLVCDTQGFKGRRIGREPQADKTRQQKNTQAVIRGCANAHPVRTCYGSGNGYRTPACQAVAGPFEAVSGLGWEVCDG